MFLIEGSLTAVLAALATAGGLAFCSVRDGAPADDPAWNAAPVANASQQLASEPVQPLASTDASLAQLAAELAIAARRN